MQESAEDIRSVDRTTETKTSSSYTWHMLASLKSLSCDGDFCDVKIVSGDYQVRAHRTVLASATEYFKGMFLNDTKEAKTGVVDFSKMPPEVVKQCINFIYSGNVEISMAITRDLLDASEMMQLPDLSKLCVEYLAERVDMKNCTEVISSHLYNKDSLNEPLKRFLRAHFKKFSGTNEFTSLTFGALKHCYHLLRKCSASHEGLKWLRLLKWIETDADARKRHFAELFSLIDLTVFPKNVLKTHISSNPYVINSIQCIRLVMESILDDNDERAESTIVSFETGHDLISSCSMQENPVVCSPVKITVDMDVIHYRGNIFVGTGLKIYAYLNEDWVSKDVDFSKVRRTSPCVTCPNCHADHWYVGNESELHRTGSGYWMTHPSQYISFKDSFFHSFFNGSIQCRRCHMAVIKSISKMSCYNRCVGVGDTVYMLTMEYIIEYNISTSRIVHHDASIRLGNGFSVAASSECIYAVGGRGTENGAAAFDMNSKLVTRLMEQVISHELRTCDIPKRAIVYN